LKAFDRTSPPVTAVCGDAMEFLDFKNNSLWINIAVFSVAAVLCHGGGLFMLYQLR
jgi:hypothetical protein